MIINFGLKKQKPETEDEGSGKDMMKKHRRQVFFSGIITAVGSFFLHFISSFFFPSIFFLKW
jgi:hypothetical protein